MQNYTNTGFIPTIQQPVIASTQVTVWDILRVMHPVISVGAFIIAVMALVIAISLQSSLVASTK